MPSRPPNEHWQDDQERSQQQAARERDGRGEGFVGNPHLMAIIETMKERRWGDALCLMGALKGMGETPTTEFVKKPATSALGEIVEKVIGVRQVGAADEGLVSHDAWTVCPIVGEGGTDPSSYPREGDEQPPALISGGAVMLIRAAAAPAT